MTGDIIGFSGRVGHEDWLVSTYNLPEQRFPRTAGAICRSVIVGTPNQWIRGRLFYPHEGALRLEHTMETKIKYYQRNVDWNAVGDSF